MGNTGGKRAWEFLRRNPGYLEAESGAPPAAAEPAPFPMRVQTGADLEAAAWGLLAWEDPMAEGGRASPFWAEAPELEAIATPSPTLAALAAAPGWRVSGLRLAGGPVVLKVEHGAAAVQLRVADGAGFDPEGGIRVATDPDLRFPERLRRAAGLWPAVAVDSKKAAAGFPTGSCSRSSTHGSPAAACA